MGGQMDKVGAQALLSAERARVEALLDATGQRQQEDRAAADDQPAGYTDPSEPFIDEATDDAVAAQLHDRLDAISRAEERLEKGTFGLSVRSGKRIPDARLEADPAAELTVEEEQAEEARGAERL
jgi:DnaK suppressor protein